MWIFGANGATSITASCHYFIFIFHITMITYSFKITSLNKLLFYMDEDNNEYHNLITRVHYYIKGVDEDGMSSVYQTHLDLPKPSSSTFKPYNELTEEEMIGWITSLTSSVVIEFMQSIIETNITNSKTTTTALPWNV